MCPGEIHDTATCEQISALLSRVGDKWTVLIVASLGHEPKRFNSLRRSIGDISQKMLATTLRSLERDGFVTRTVAPTTPPQVEYALTDLGHSLLGPVGGLADWTRANAHHIEAARRRYAGLEAEAVPVVREGTGPLSARAQDAPGR